MTSFAAMGGGATTVPFASSVSTAIVPTGTSFPLLSSRSTEKRGVMGRLPALRTQTLTLSDFPPEALILSVWGATKVSSDCTADAEVAAHTATSQTIAKARGMVICARSHLKCAVSIDRTARWWLGCSVRRTPPTHRSIGNLQRINARCSDAWDRYYQVGVDPAPLLGTPGVFESGRGQSLALTASEFVQRADRGFFLISDVRSSHDALEAAAAVTGTLPSGAFETPEGARRKRVRRTATGSHVEIEQLVRGARVVGGDVRVHANRGGVYAITGRPIGDLPARDPGPPPAIDARAAAEACIERFELEDGPRSCRVDLVVFPEGGGATWAYEVAFVVPQDLADVRVYLRTDDLKVLLSHNVASAASGQSRVYPVNPLQTPNLVDARLDGLDEPGRVLSGPWIDVTQATGERLQCEGGDFRVDPEDPGFDEVQAYYHLRRVMEYFAGLTEPGLITAAPFAPMRALVRDPRMVNNAAFLPSTGRLHFGIFEQDRSAARSASMVFHEFTHAVTTAVSELGFGLVKHSESRGLSEGYSDYFAATLLDDPRFGDYVTNQPQGGRNCSDPALRFPMGYRGKEHVTGAAWAAVLWAIRQGLDPTTVDALVLESVEFVGPSSTFDDGLAALYTVDEELHAGANRELIGEAFQRRLPS
jgi:hypothetical protein